MNPGIIIASHLKSKRIPQKALFPLNGKPALYWLLCRLNANVDMPIILAVPDSEAQSFNAALDLSQFKNVTLFTGHPTNVLDRITRAAYHYNLDPIIRITHDDLLICPFLLKNQLDFYVKNQAQYVFCKQVAEGLAAEIIAYELLEKSAKELSQQFHVEHISYYVKHKETKILEFIPDISYQKKMRLTLDYPMDTLLLEILFNRDPSPDYASFPLETINYVDQNRYLLKINNLPKVTLYTPCHNYEKYLVSCIRSIQKQTFRNFEYFYIDDGGSDNSVRIAAQYPETKILINTQKKGISFSSNRILERARGTYIMRIDADDVLLPYALEAQVHYMETHPDMAICYAGYYETDPNLNIRNTIIKNEQHHLAGSLIRRACLNEIKFKDHLTHFDSLDIYRGLSERFEIGYLETPLFYYRKHKDSWSHNPENLAERTRQLADLNQHYFNPMSEPE